MEFFATCPAGVADLLAAELKELGAAKTRELKSGVEFEGELESGYRACLWSRTANRILLHLATVDAPTANELYKGVQTIDWSSHLSVGGTFAVEFTGGNDAINNTQFGALKTKDAVVDQFREKFGERPSIDVERPDVRVNVHLNREQATISIDLSGESLHRRGYRARGVAAPLKENLAAAILLRSGWKDIAAVGGGLVDPMCGSATFLIEAALIAGDIAPGLMREHFGFLKWKQHDAALWRRLGQEADGRRAKGKLATGILRGYDHDPAAIRAAIENIARAGLQGVLHVERRELADFGPEPAKPGLIVTNPPYGERIGDETQLRELYSLLGRRLREHFIGWRAVVFTGNFSVARAIDIHAKRSHTLFNGAIECRLLRLEVQPEQFDTPESRPSRDQKLAEARQRPGAEMFANRLRKNVKKFADWARRESIDCYRVYDADMPEYAFAIDVYRGEQTYAYVQEYAPPDSIERGAAATRRLEALSVIPEVLAIPADKMFVRTRRQQKGASQYEKLDHEHEFVVVHEGPFKFLVNFTDYLDTGLFLDHRPTRKLLGEMARGKRFLNLFAYTGSASVYAAGGGATATTTVDMSNTYIDWSKRNMAINHLAGPEHGFVREDALKWLSDQAAQRAASGQPPTANSVQPATDRQQRTLGTQVKPYDLIFIDPPTFSRSKRMEDTFDVQRDHPKLLKLAAELLAPGGAMVFSNNFTKFKLDQFALADFEIEDISRATLPADFERNPRIHFCFILRRNAN